MTKEDKKAPDELSRLRKLIELMNQHDVVELEVEPDGHVRLRRREDKAAAPASVTIVPAAQGASAAASTAAESGAPSSAAPAPAPAESLTEFKSPIVGTFYRASSPDKEPFVDRGTRVRPDSVLCIIEAMKVMNEIRAELSGEVVEVLAKNGEAVEFGQPLFLIRPE